VVTVVPVSALTSRTAAHRSPPWALLALTGFTLLGAGIRIAELGQSLFGDERYTYAVVAGRSFAGVWHEVYTTSITPPLDYWLAWLALHLGSAPSLIRLPSLLAGTALIPLLFVLGRRLGGNLAGLVAAAVAALSPFAIFYSTEGRAYEVMLLLVAVSTLALLRALDTGRRRWWVLHAVSACAAMWSHYTALFVLIVQAAWALWTHRERWRPIVAAEAAAVVGFLPWVPGYVHQRHNEGVQLLGFFNPLHFRDVVLNEVRVVIGHPFVRLSDALGVAGIVLAAGLAVLILAGGLALVRARPRRPPLNLRDERWLFVLLALATPVGLLLNGLVGSQLYGLRNISASQPALIVVVGLVVAGLARAAPRAAVPALAVAGAALAVVGLKTTEAKEQRPPFVDAARYLDGVAGRAAILDVPFVFSPDARLHQSTLALYVRRPHQVYLGATQARSAWRRQQAGRPLYVVEPRYPQLTDALASAGAPAGLTARQDLLGGPDGRAIARSRRTFAGFYDLVVRRFEGSVTGRLTGHGASTGITWTLGRHVRVDPRFARGAVDVITPAGQPLELRGWALTREAGPRPVDWFLVFAGRRLFAVSPGGVPRPDVAQANGGGPVVTGFDLLPLSAPADRSRLRVYAVTGSRATELPAVAAPAPPHG
jgi:4-amino-4-deoxy-L-arabinose transferase-like glycosyltransferase